MVCLARMASRERMGDGGGRENLFLRRIVKSAQVRKGGKEGGREGNIVKDVGYGARGKKRRASEGSGAGERGRTMTDAISPKILRRPSPSLLALD